ncbi:hypothetical protein [Mesobacillus sp. S13]|nr:hypothetical protein [Mesobacillus sp. S13]
MKYEIGEEIERFCSIDGMNTVQRVIESTYTDTNAFVCVDCGQEDEELA